MPSWSHLILSAMEVLGLGAEVDMAKDDIADAGDR